MPGATTPTYAAAMLFSPGTTNYLRLGHATYGKLGTGKLLGNYSDSGWSDLTSRLLSFSCSHGREDELSGVTAGTFTAVFDDDDGALDPENSSGAYYPNVVLRRRWRAQATWAAVTYTLGYQFASSYSPYRAGGFGATVVVAGSDLFTRLQQQPLTKRYPPQTTGARIAALLAEVNWPASMQSLDTGHLTLPAADLTGKTVQEHLDAIVRAERGVCFVGGDGVVRFHARYHRQSVTSRGTFGAGGYAIRSIEADYTDRGLINEARMSLPGGGEVYAANTASQQTYDTTSGVTFGTEVAELLPADPGNVAQQSYCQSLVNRHGTPVGRVRAITLDPQNDPTNLWPHVLGAEVGDKITLTHNLAGTKGLSAQDYFIERIDHQVTIDGDPPHLCTWALSRAYSSTYYSAFTLGHSTFGKLGTGRLGF